MKTRNILISVFCVFMTLNLNAHTYTFSVTGKIAQFIDENTTPPQWGEWSNITPLNGEKIIINDSKIFLYLDKTHEQDIVSIDKYPKYTDNRQQIIYYCLDSHGWKSIVTLVKDGEGNILINTADSESRYFLSVKTSDNMNTLFPSIYEVNQHIVSETKKGAMDGEAIDIYYMGLYYQNGEYGLQKDYSQAERYFNQLKDMGVYLGYNQLAYLNAWQKNYSLAIYYINLGIDTYKQRGASRYEWDWTLENLYDSKGEILLMENKYEEALPIYNYLKNSTDQKIQDSEFVIKMKKYIEKNGTFTYSPSSLDFDYYSSTKYLKVSSYSQWEYNNPYWLELTWNSNTKSFAVKCTTNESSTSRTGYITLISKESDEKVYTGNAKGRPTTQQQSQSQRYGYTDFWVDKNAFYVSAEGGYYRLGIYGESYVRLSDCWTDSNWLEEERLQYGGGQFHVKKNRTGKVRNSILYIKDTRGNVIKVSVLQAAQ